MTYKPRVGVAMRIEHETRRFYLGRDYSEALEGAGCLPVHIALIPRQEYIDGIADTLDGILLPGADCDVDPFRFGEPPHPRLKKVVPEKDEADLLLLSAAERKEIPVMAICFGMQLLNVSRGGDLYQDIEAQVPNAIKHDQGPPVTRRSHSIAIAGDCRLADLAGTENGNEVKVNSHHHQAIRNVGKDLAATAWAPDGIIEAFQDTRPDRYAVGYQWHPELDWQSDELSQSIFASFVTACRESATQKCNG